MGSSVRLVDSEGLSEGLSLSQELDEVMILANQDSGERRNSKSNGSGEGVCLACKN